MIRVLLSAAVSAVLAFSSTTVFAWTETFEGGVHNIWRGAVLDFSGSPVNISNLQLGVATSGGNGFGTVSYSNTALPALSPTSLRGVVATGWIDQSFTDTHVSALINPNNQPHSRALGLLARSSQDFSGYILGLDTTAAGRLFLMRRDPGFTTLYVPLAQTLFLNANSNAAYWMEFDVVGSQLTGRLYDSDRNALLASISTMDTTLSQGVAGVFALALDNAPASPQTITAYGEFDNVSAVPEPSTYGLMLAGLWFVGWAVRRKRQG